MKILSQRPTHVAAVATVLLVIKTFRQTEILLNYQTLSSTDIWMFQYSFTLRLIIGRCWGHISQALGAGV